MQLGFRHLGLCGSVFLIGLVSTSNAGVSLFVTDGDATPSAASAAPGSDVSISVKLTSETSAPTDGVLGIDYFLVSSAANVFTIKTRNSQTVSSAFPGVISTDLQVANTPITSLASMDLGGTVNDINSPVSNGTVEVADFKITVGAGVSPGVYSFSVTDDGSGFANANFTTGTYKPFTAFSVTVTPEPSMFLLGAGLPLLAARRRRA